MFFDQFDLIDGLIVTGKPLAQLSLTVLPDAFWADLTGVADAAQNSSVRSFLQTQGGVFLRSPTFLYFCEFRCVHFRKVWNVLEAVPEPQLQKFFSDRCAIYSKSRKICVRKKTECYQCLQSVLLFQNRLCEFFDCSTPKPPPPPK